MNMHSIFNYNQELIFIHVTYTWGNTSEIHTYYHSNPRAVTLRQDYNLHYSIVKLIATSRKEHRLSVFENRVLRKILGPKRDEVNR